MATAQVRCTSALSGEVLLPTTSLPCVGLPQRVRALLGSRPSRPVTIFLNGAVVDEELSVASDGHVELTAAIGDALTPDERQGLMQKLDDAEDSEAEDAALCDVFAGFSAAARDDTALVLAAVRKDGYCLPHASPLCQNDREVVLAAVQQTSWTLRYAGAACKNDKEVVLVAVQRNGMVLQYASEALRNDKEVVLAAVARSPDSIRFASEACQHDPEIQRAAGR